MKMEQHYIDARELKAELQAIEPEYRRAKRQYQDGKLDKASFLSIAMDRNILERRYFSCIKMLRYVRNRTA